MDSIFFDETYLGLPLANYLWFAAIVLVTLLIKKPLTRFIANYSCSITQKYSSREHAAMFHELIRRPTELLLQAILFFIAVRQLSPLLDSQVVYYKKRVDKPAIDIRIGDVVDHIFLLVMIIAGTQVLAKVIDFIYQVQQNKAYDAHNKGRQQLLPLVKDVIKLLLWTVSVFWILGAVFQVNVPALIAGLGIGGIAIALAAKESVENLFAAFTILSDKPFQVGDTIKLGTFEGKVERIGFRSTRIRSGNGSAYIIPNKKLIGENLENLTNRDTSGVSLTINIKYGVAEDKLQQMIAELKDMVTKTLHVKTPVSVNLEGFGENTFQVVLSYHLPFPEVKGMPQAEIKQAINLGAYAIINKYTGAQQQGPVTQSKAPGTAGSEDNSGEENNKNDLSGLGGLFS